MQSKKEQVLQALLKIPKGKLTTYKHLALHTNTHPRAIAMYMKHNKDPKTYPCYKVINHNLSIGGYSAYDGIKTKEELIKKDNIPIINNKIPKEYIHTFQQSKK